LNKISSSLFAGGTEPLGAIFTPSTATNQGVAWTSTDSAVARVDAAGKVEALAVGTATIRATSADGGFIAECAVTVASATILSSQAWWGPWARLDRVETWYIAADHLELPSGPTEPWAATGAAFLSTISANIELVAGSTDMVKVTRSGSVFYLYRKANATATFSGTAVSQAGAGKGLSFGTVIANIALVVRNVKNYAEQHLAQTLVDGTFQIVNAIKGDLYEITPQITGAAPVTVRVTENAIDVGVVTVTAPAVSYNFKVSAEPSDNPWLFADGQSQNATFTVTNVGTARSLAPTYTLSAADARLTIGGSLVNNFTSFEPGASQTLTLPLSVSSVAGAYEDFVINVKLEIWNGPTWEDRATVRFYKGDKLEVNLQNGGGHGSLLTPTGEVIPLASRLVAPRADTGYSVILSGATAASETKYALWLGATSAFTPDLTAFVNPGSYEPNDSLANAKPLYINDTAPLVSYLMIDDMDCFRIVSAPLAAPVGMPTLTVNGSTASLAWASVPAATKYFVYANGTEVDAAGTTSTSVSGLDYARGSCYAVAAFNDSLGFSIQVPVVETVAVAGGTFNNGTSDVTVSSFAMAPFEVTQWLYWAITGQNPSYFAALADSPLRPVEQVSWYNAVEFCNALSARTGLEPVYTVTNRNPATGQNISSATVTMDFSKNGWRLPTEAEWEFAARGGMLTHGYTYAGSNALDDVAWYATNSGNQTHAVGGKAANELGIYDFSGNVWEWCWDWHGDYPSGAQTDPVGPATGWNALLRGGSWYVDEVGARVSWRSGNSPNYRGNYDGFRLVRGAP
jgi:formylglycine-generating enzyme required for sulfatase activity